MNPTSTLNHPFFARLWIMMSAHETELMAQLRAENLAGLTGRVLEIGAGTGSNFVHYPSTVDEVMAIEPEQRLAEHARVAAASAPVPVRVITETAEEFAATPGGAEPFDAVVCSLVLCSIDDPETVLNHVRDRLRPGGQLRFLEHVASAGTRGRMQVLADATLWPRMFGNCHTHRDTEAAISAAGFRIDTARHRWTLPAWVPLPVSEFAIGRAVRP